MAVKKSSSNNGKGVALLKRAKIDSAQKNMLIAVCLASIVLGVTVVGVIYLSKKITFNVVKIAANSEEIDNLVNAQKNLTDLAVSVSELAKNERLEVVASERSETKCDQAALKTIEADQDLNDNIEITRTCSALRAIADTLPSTMNQEATNSSLNWLIVHNDKMIKLLSLTNGESGTSGNILDQSGNALNLKSLSTNISIKDKPTKINKAIMAIESSIRNFDITSATISWSDYDRGAKNDSDIEFVAVYRSYYSDEVKIDSKEKIICADERSEKCIKAMGSNK